MEANGERKSCDTDDKSADRSFSVSELTLAISSALVNCVLEMACAIYSTITSANCFCSEFNANCSDENLSPTTPRHCLEANNGKNHQSFSVNVWVNRPEG